ADIVGVPAMLSPGTDGASRARLGDDHVQHIAAVRARVWQLPILDVLLHELVNMRVRVGGYAVLRREGIARRIIKQISAVERTFADAPVLRQTAEEWAGHDR